MISAPERSLRRDEVEVMLIYSMSISADGSMADREGALGWMAPSEQVFRSTPRS